MNALVNTRDEPVFHNLAVFHPIIPILPRTLFKVASTSMCQDGEEEERVEKGDGSVETRGQAPREGLEPIGGVIDLPGKLPPTGSEEFVAVLGLDVGGIFDL